MASGVSKYCSQLLYGVSIITSRNGNDNEYKNLLMLINKA
jgi:hypothetical protein